MENFSEKFEKFTILLTSFGLYRIVTQGGAQWQNLSPAGLRGAGQAPPRTRAGCPRYVVFVLYIAG
jgi:hypothetical protein